MKRKINYTKYFSGSLLNYFVFCKRNKVIKNRKYFLISFFRIFKHFKIMYKKQIELMSKSFFLNYSCINTLKLLGSVKESNLKEKFNYKPEDNLFVDLKNYIDFENQDIFLLLSLSSVLNLYNLSLLLVKYK